MVCKKCGSENVTMQVIEEKKRSGIISTLIQILICCTLIGIPFFVLWKIIRGRKTKTVTYAVCQECGARYKVK